MSEGKGLEGEACPGLERNLTGPQNLSSFCYHQWMDRIRTLPHGNLEIQVFRGGGTRDQEHVTEPPPGPDLGPCSERLLRELPRASPRGVACRGVDRGPAGLWLQLQEGWRAQLLPPAGKGQPSGRQGGVQFRMRGRKTRVQRRGVGSERPAWIDPSFAY